MSLDDLGNNQTIILHNCEINNEKYDLVITPHKQTIGYIRTKRQTIKRKNFKQTKTNYSKKIFKAKKCNLEELYKLKDSVNKSYQFNDQLFFSDSESTSHSSMQGKRRIKKSYKNKPVRLYHWNQPIKHIEHYALTVIKHKNDSK